MNASKVQEILDLIGANEAMRSTLGMTAKLRLGFGQGLSDQEIAEDVANAYLPVLESVQQTPAQDALVLSINLKARSTPLPRPTIEEILKRAAGWTTLEVVAAARQSSMRLDYLVTATLADGTGNDIDLCQTPAFLGAERRTPDEYRQRLAALRSCRRDLEDEIEGMQPTLAAKVLEEASSANRLCRAIDFFHGKGIGFFRSPEARGERLLSALEAARAAFDQLLIAEAEKEALIAATAAIDSDIHHIVAELEAVKVLLKAPLPTHRQELREALIRPHDLADTLPDLVLASKFDGTRFPELVQGLVDVVTLAGLCRLVGASTARIDEARPFLRNPTIRIEGPSWGAAKSTAPSELVFDVLPPVEPEVFQALSAEFDRFDGTRVLVTADTAAGGVRLVRLTFQFATEVSEIVTHFLKRQIEESLRVEEPAVLFPRGIGCLDRLGIELDIPASQATAYSERTNANHE